MSSVITIGNFDGVHLGHVALLRRAREVARASGGAKDAGGAKVVVLSFDPHPASVLRPGTEPRRLTTWDQRAELLRRAGADDVVPMEPTPDLLSTSAEAFIERLVAEHAPIAMVEGADFRFGKGRRGDVAMLRAIGKERGFDVHVVEPVTAVLDDHGEVTASSTLVRWLVEQGRVRDAARVLGRAYSIVGRVEQGARRGRELGFPTANIRTPCLVPADGVYAGRARVGDGREFAAAVSVGTNPQFDGVKRTVEAHLLMNGEGSKAGRHHGIQAGQCMMWTAVPGLPEYGWGVELEFLSYLRDQARYESVGALVEQIERDCGRAAEVIA